MRFVVWMAHWQIQCCGDPFQVGSKISWTLDDGPDRESLSSALGDDAAHRITHVEEHHGGLPDDLPPTEGTVRRITSAFCRYAPGTGQGKERILSPVPGTTVLRKVSKATGWEPKSPDLRFIGYIVELDVAEDSPEDATGRSRT